MMRGFVRRRWAWLVVLILVPLFAFAALRIGSEGDVPLSDIERNR